MIFFFGTCLLMATGQALWRTPALGGARGGMLRMPFLEENVERIDNTGEPTASHVRAIVHLESSMTKTEPNWRLLSSDSMELAK